MWWSSGLTSSSLRAANSFAARGIPKLVDTPLEILSRLSELGVAPPVLASGVHEGRRYVVQRAVSGPHPDHDWFAANLRSWAELVGAYLNDEDLRRMLASTPGTWRLAVPDAVAMINSQPAPTSAALREPSFQTSLEQWRQQATEIMQLPPRPIHPDPHWGNYVIADGRPYLLDWDNVDLSDPMRDVGSQVWIAGLGFHRHERDCAQVGWLPTMRLSSFGDTGVLSSFVDRGMMSLNEDNARRETGARHHHWRLEQVRGDHQSRAHRLDAESA